MSSLFTLVSILFHLSKCIDIGESPTGAVLSFPSVIDGPLYDKSYLVAPSQFGYHAYGGSLEGVLVLPTNTTYHKECPKAQEPVDSNPYVHFIKDWFIEDDDINDYILVIDRGDCYFVQKIELAQSIGASGVVICDSKSENLFTMWMPQDWSDDINIPSVLLSKANCATLMAHIGVQNWNPNSIENTIYPDVETINWTIATIEWGLPHNDDRVEWELWTSSNDFLGSEFKHNFNTTAIMLDKANDTIFTPHMYTLNGSHWGCDLFGTKYLPCKKQCTNSGRYCAVDPEYDLSKGLDGMDVIQENLRSLCVWEYDKQMNGIMDDILWWDYAVLWDENCGVYSDSSIENFNEACSYTQMNTLDTTGALAAFVAKCIADSGGYGYKDGKNTILDRETRLKYNSSIYALPMIRVNEFLIHGNIDCVPPVTSANCEVLAAICAGFLPGTEPEVCSLTPAPTIAVCNVTEQDCAGKCHGSHKTDACGKCLLVSDPQWNECIGCNGQINETYDCEGVCGGHYAVNPCGYCKDVRLPGFASFGVDCNGTCSMELREDECGNCISESSPQWNSCIGCDNIPNSGFKFNSCGRCIDGNRLDFDVFGKDCNGDCDGNALYDACNSCLVPSSPEWNSCVGCDGNVNSNKSYNECGLCIDVNDPDFDSYGRDCRGLCSPSFLEAKDKFVIDSCGKCLAQNDPNANDCCNGDANKGYNECGLCIFKNVTDFDERGRDCLGECSGNHVVDLCGHCLLPSDESFDDCDIAKKKCGPNNEFVLDCMGVCNGNHSINVCGICMATYPEYDFETFGKDCNGLCNGDAMYDRCGNCLYPASEEWDKCVGCDNVINSGKIYNDCGACVLSTDVDFDKYGRDCLGNCGNLYAIDECGECLLPSDPAWNECNDGSGKLDGDENEASSMNTTFIALIGSGSFIAICCAFVVIVVLYKKHQEMKRQFDEIKRNYQPMQDIQPSPKEIKIKAKTKESVPDEENDDE